MFRALLGFFAALLALFQLPAIAREPAPAPDLIEKVRAPSPIAEAGPALWKLSDSDTTVYLFGTVHVLPKGINWFHGPVSEAFHASDSLVTEIIEGDPGEMQSIVLRKAVLPAGQTLRAQMTDDQRATYETALKEYGVPAEMFDRFDPWYAAVGLSTLPLLEQGYAPEQGVEKLLGSLAQNAGKPHLALETAEEQLSLFDALPLEVQHRYLGEVIAQLPSIRSELEAMVAAWQRGDEEKIASVMNAERSDPVLIKALLTDRNARWADWVETRMGEPGTIFLAVGAGHLAGEESLQAMLERKGMAVERLQ